MNTRDLLEQYAGGAQLLHQAVSGMSREQTSARPVAGKWSTLEVVCHLADAEILYAERIKRVLAEDRPALASMDPDLYMARLACQARAIEDELSVVDAVRRHVLGILKEVQPADFERVGVHSADGPLTLATLLRRIAAHIPHHARFIAEKRAALASCAEGSR
jgi:uncharacterized damage-inducible protein DinB